MGDFGYYSVDCSDCGYFGTVTAAATKEEENWAAYDNAHFKQNRDCPSAKLSLGYLSSQEYEEASREYWNRVNPPDERTADEVRLSCADLLDKIVLKTRSAAAEGLLAAITCKGSRCRG